MVEQDYKRARGAAAKELDQLLAVQKQTEQRILHLRNTIASLDALSDSSPRKPAELPSMADAIRSVFKAASANEPFSARQIRDALIEMGFNDKNYSNLLASVHVVLKRLQDKGELKFGLNSNGKIWRLVERDFLADL